MRGTLKQSKNRSNTITLIGNVAWFYKNGKMQGSSTINFPHLIERYLDAWAKLNLPACDVIRHVENRVILK